MIKNILLDLDETIFAFSISERKALCEALLDIGVEPTEEILDRYHVVNLAQWKKLEQGLIDREEVKVGRYRNLFNEFGIESDPKSAAANYERHLSEKDDLLPGVIDFLETLKSHYNLYAVSNGIKPVQEGRIDNTGIRKYFSAVYISEDIGFEKPFKEFFDYCFNDSKIEKSETILIGDSLTSDIQGGINAGVPTIWFNPKKSENTKGIKPTYEAHTYEEILKILDTVK